MKTILTALSISLLAGCAGNDRLYYVDNRFSAEEEQAIQAANDMWCTASRNALCMDLVFGARVDVSEASRNAIVKSGDRAAQYRFPNWIERDGTAAFHHPAGSFDSDLIIVLSERVAPENLRVAVAHEMGHVYTGPEHLADPAAIMYGDLTGAESKEAVTCDDLAAAGVKCDQ